MHNISNQGSSPALRLSISARTGLKPEQEPLFTVWKGWAVRTDGHYPLCAMELPCSILPARHAGVTLWCSVLETDRYPTLHWKVSAGEETGPLVKGPGSPSRALPCLVLSQPPV